ncbi:MAG: alpha/beta fold hydrolase, partial [Balneolaceae bacterium]|nr:alpha/beta fold hydrolase [Balneolaceae bacterium]
MEKTEGFITVNDTDLYYKRMGSGPPVIVVHGGPLLDHGYLVDPLKPLAGDYELVFYDQRLSGRSSADSDSTYNRLDTFVEDIEELRATLELGRVHLIAHSWGGLLAMKYALHYPGNLRKLILLNSMPASTELWNREEMMLAERMTRSDSLARVE